MPGIERVDFGVGFEDVPEVVEVAALASLDDASEFLRADLREGVCVDRRVLGKVSPVDD